MCLISKLEELNTPVVVSLLLFWTWNETGRRGVEIYFCEVLDIIQTFSISLIIRHMKQGPSHSHSLRGWESVFATTAPTRQAQAFSKLLVLVDRTRFSKLTDVLQLYL